MKQIIMGIVAAMAMGAATALAGSAPQRSLDECTGGEGAIHVKGWAYDPDASSQSIGVLVYLTSTRAARSSTGTSACSRPTCRGPT